MNNLYEMGPADNVLYFPNNIDVRLCPKNGMSSIKEVFRLYSGHAEYVGKKHRYSQVKDYSDMLDRPFRKNSHRIAVVRDPVERFKSACEYVASNRIDHIRNGNYDLPEIGDTLESVILSIENGTTKNNHFYTQSWYMGKPADYDILFNMSELPLMFRFLQDACELDIKVDNIHHNRTRHKLYGNDISADNMARIHTLYEKDYKNGWFTNKQ